MKGLKIQLALLSLLALSSLPSNAKTALETQADADQETSKQLTKESEVAKDSDTSALAQTKGQAGRAALHAKKAALEQKEADKIADKANKLQSKADEKAVKESR